MERIGLQPRHLKRGLQILHGVGSQYFILALIYI